MLFRSGCGRGPASRYLTGPGGQNLPHDDVINVRSGYSGALEHRLDGQSSEVGAAEILERAHEPADRRPCSADDDRLIRLAGMVLPLFDIIRVASSHRLPVGTSGVNRLSAWITLRRLRTVSYS